ncbi:hypothetical protein FOD75_10920 (plasmid) [Limosilactobacillus reuteri]|uniref:Uncharacterized protein n=1 Tax=Limosilactobacillus reuteri TaxID=1598 RepID=A0A517D8C3_LIMRT|nr:hypothetical protein [Limosilactobacillus reuteri]QDR73601.1 hypothetical protein FOD75_10920 [Limosilactobacillus reuteri]
MEKNIRFIAVDGDMRDVKEFLDRSDNYVELDKDIFSRRMDPYFMQRQSRSGVKHAFPVHHWVGQLQSQPRVIVNHSQGDYKFIDATIINQEEYRSAKKEHRLVFPMKVRLYADDKDADLLLSAKSGDTLVIDGYFHPYYANKDGNDQNGILAGYVQIEQFYLDKSTSVRKLIHEKFAEKPKQDSNSKLADLVNNATPEQKAALLQMLQGKNAPVQNQSATRSAQPQPAEPSHVTNDQPQAKKNHYEGITDDALKNAINQDF